MNKFLEKIFSQEEWSDAKEFLDGRDLVFTNGCFDLLHPGHLFYLSEAARLSSNLVIGLNSDDSVTRLKGASRPINNFAYRSAMLSGLEQVSCVIEFDDDTPLRLIEYLIPSVLVKGGDYELKEIVGRSVVEKNGGLVKTIPFVDNYSSTALIEKIKKS